MTPAHTQQEQFSTKRKDYKQEQFDNRRKDYKQEQFDKRRQDYEQEQFDTKKSTPFGITYKRSKVLYRAAQQEQFDKQRQDCTLSVQAATCHDVCTSRDCRNLEKHIVSACA